jgi:hypothetical protein
VTKLVPTPEEETAFDWLPDDGSWRQDDEQHMVGLGRLCVAGIAERSAALDDEPFAWRVTAQGRRAKVKGLSPVLDER